MSNRRRTGQSAHRAPRPLPPAEPAPPPIPAERILIDQIAAGTLDEHLSAIAQAAYARIELVETVKTLHALSQLAPGDHVRFTDQVRPRYLTGVHGTVIALGKKTATVRIDQSSGRFVRGDTYNCPPLILQRIGRMTA